MWVRLIDSEKTLHMLGCQSLPWVRCTALTVGDPKLEMLFSPFTSHFNRLQSECFSNLFSTDRNLILSAPTGSGKTGLLEIAILRLIKHGPFEAKGKLRLTPFSQVQHVQKARIIVTTPEKWDSVTRQLRDTGNLVKLVHLLLVDEVHSLKDGVRGATLEVVITRVKSMQALSEHNEYPKIRIIAVSATVPNLEDLGSWLTDSEGIPALVGKFGDDYRPVKLKKIVIGYPVNGSQFQFADSLKYRLPELLRNYSEKKPSLIFCSTRRDCSSAAEHLAGELGNMEPFVRPGTRQALLDASSRITDKKLAGLVAKGFGFHHAGIANRADRYEVEQLFLKNVLLVICTTTTLAVGVNLPAHLVIIKGTSFYDFSSGKCIDISDVDVMQQMGRAGRPQFDHEGTAVILTSKDKEDHFLHLGEELIESTLHESLIEHLNAEIALGNIRSSDQALQWLKSTFLYVRIKKNPAYYRLKNCSAQDAQLSAENRLEAIFNKDLDELERATLVERDSADSSIAPTDQLESLSKAEEFEVRFHSDKAILNLLNKDPDIRFPIQGKVTDVHQKIFLLIQAAIGGVSIDQSKERAGEKSHRLTSDSSLVIRGAERLVRGMVQVFLTKNDYRSIIGAIRVAQAISCRMWESSSTKTRQIEGVGPQYSKILAKAGIVSFAALLDTEPSRLEVLVSRNPPFGSKVIEAAAKFPRPSMRLLQVPAVANSVKRATIEVSVALGLENAQKTMLKYKDLPITFYFVVGTTLGQLVETRFIPITKLRDGYSFTVKGKCRNNKDALIFSLICNEIGTSRGLTVAGIDIEATVSPKGSDSSLERQDSYQDDEDDAFWNSIDLDALEHMVSPKGSSVVVPGSTQSVEVRPGYVPCKHTCADKNACRHLCCREGVPIKSVKRRNVARSPCPERPARSPLPLAASKPMSVPDPVLKSPQHKKPAKKVRKIVTLKDLPLYGCLEVSSSEESIGTAIASTSKMLQNKGVPRVLKISRSDSSDQEMLGSLVLPSHAVSDDPASAGLERGSSTLKHLGWATSDPCEESEEIDELDQDADQPDDGVKTGSPPKPFDDFEGPVLTQISDDLGSMAASAFATDAENRYDSIVPVPELPADPAVSKDVATAIDLFKGVFG
ncbi:Sec63 [Kappamyces sp. JEL0680]|nr:Sec63 [Kappamyces sp. JEL0680]